MLKGRSTIQLFDAVSGKKVLEQSDTNMITNALDIIANCKDKLGLFRWWRKSCVVTGSNEADRLTVSPFIQLLPLYKRALGGVLLWDENITEDPSIIFPPKGVYELGHAGGPYGGDDLYRGSYNANESGEISGGWRHVWDFDTDKANGTIKCLSLTSWHGGNIGYHGCFEDDLYPLYNTFYLHNDARFDNVYSSSQRVSWTGDNQGVIVYLKKMEDGSLRQYKRYKTTMFYADMPDPNNISITTEGLKWKERVMLPITLTNNFSTVYVYQDQIHELALTAEDRLQHKIFGMDGGEVSTKVIDLPFSCFNNSIFCPAVYRDGYYYCVPHTHLDMVKLDEHGQELARIPMLESQFDEIHGVTINEYNNEITFSIKYQTGSDVNPYPAVLNSKDEIAVHANRKYYTVSSGNIAETGLFPQFVKTDDQQGPFVYFADTAGGITPLLNSAYLATINNLKMPITKTSAQTMKITYEIYDE